MEMFFVSPLQVTVIPEAGIKTELQNIICVSVSATGVGVESLSDFLHWLSANTTKINRMTVESFFILFIY
jgi:hypothetical protein